MIPSTIKKGVLLTGALLAMTMSSQAANPPAPSGGRTTVSLAPAFLAALEELHVTPGIVSPGQLYSGGGATLAAFPITTGSVDLADGSLEVDHAGGLSLTAGSTTVELTAFAIEVSPNTQAMLTGLVSVNGKLIGRLPLFDLSLAKAQISNSNNFVNIANVNLTLDEKASAALSQVFHTSIATVAIGTADVRTVLGPTVGN
jgi:hypothetical protein